MVASYQVERETPAGRRPCPLAHGWIASISYASQRRRSLTTRSKRQPIYSAEPPSLWGSLFRGGDLVEGTLCQLHGKVNGIGCRDRAVDLVPVARLDVAELDAIGDIGYIVPGQPQS